MATGPLTGLLEALMKRDEILDLAKEYITVDRAATHGEAEDLFGSIAAGWQWWMEIRPSGPMTSFDVAMMMDIFKTARAASNPKHMDNFCDKVGYSAIAGEIAAKG
jgi:hypothetical protein